MGLCHVNSLISLLRYQSRMKTSIYSRHRFHPDVIRRAAWLYFRFNLSFCDVEDMMAERGVDVSYETVRRWIDKFGLTDIKRIKQAKSSLAFRRSFVRIGGKQAYLWRTVDDEGTVLDIVIQTRKTVRWHHF